VRFPVVFGAFFGVFVFAAGGPTGPALMGGACTAGDPAAGGATGVGGGGATAGVSFETALGPGSGGFGTSVAGCDFCGVSSCTWVAGSDS